MFTALQVKSEVSTEGTYRPVTPSQDCPTLIGACRLWGQLGGPADSPPSISHSLQNLHSLTWNSGIKPLCVFS